MVDLDWGRIRGDLTRFLSDRLRLFFAVRESFGFGEGLGLGSLPGRHYPNTWLKVVPLMRPHRFLTAGPPMRISMDPERDIVIVGSEEAIISVDLISKGSH